MNQQRDKKFIDLKTENEICKLYQNNTLITHISKNVKVERHTVVRVLKRNNLYDPQKSRKHLDQDRIVRNQEVKLLSAQGLSHRQIARQLSIGKSNVGLILKQFKDQSFSLLSLKQRQNNKARYIYDEHFFEVIDTEEKAYWLGFLYADGCITERSVRLELGLMDKEHIEKLKKSIQYDAAHLYFRPDGIDSVLLNISSKVMVEDLVKLGCTVKKTFTLTFPTEDQVPLELIHHFMRGYFDGDGCIYVHEKFRCSVSLTGTYQFLDKYQEVVNKFIGKTNRLKLTKCHTNSYIYSLVYGGNQQVKKIYDFLYKNATVYLNRKKEKFEAVRSRLKTKSQKS